MKIKKKVKLHLCLNCKKWNIKKSQKKNKLSWVIINRNNHYKWIRMLLSQECITQLLKISKR
jgi:hypothetical protein